MTLLPQLDPLDSATALLDCITGKNDIPASIAELARHIDAFMYSVHALPPGAIASTSAVNDDPPETADDYWRSIVGPRYPMLGLYWEALSSVIVAGSEPQIATGDAIDDLVDIARDLSVVTWHLNRHGRDDAVAALKWAYKFHLYMHVAPLRAHLEDLLFED